MEIITSELEKHISKALSDWVLNIALHTAEGYKLDIAVNVVINDSAEEIGIRLFDRNNKDFPLVDELRSSFADFIPELVEQKHNPVHITTLVLPSKFEERWLFEPTLGAVRILKTDLRTRNFDRYTLNIRDALARYILLTTMEGWSIKDMKEVNNFYNFVLSHGRTP